MEASRQGFQQPLAEVLELLPQQPPFRFVDELTHLDAERAEGRYRFREDEWFFAGHFPGNPIVPGVILVEAMAQVAVVAHGIYLYGLEHTHQELLHMVTLFSDASVEFLSPVRPGEEVVVRSQLVFWRRRKLRSRAEIMTGERAVAVATLSGLGVAV
jgi:3-hydroxyacyl-[acyl-carrier-protein] dehydratase